MASPVSSIIIPACPTWGRSATRSVAKARSVPSRASTLIAAATLAARSRSARSTHASVSMPSMPSVPLMSAKPSLALSGRSRAAATCASGARSPLQPSDPNSGTSGSRSWSSRANSAVASGPGPGDAGRQRARPQHDHRPHDLGLDRVAEPRGVRRDQRSLGPVTPIRRDGRRRQAPEPGGHPVGGLVGGGQGLHVRPRGGHGGDRLGRQLGGRAAAGDVDHVTDGHAPGTEYDRRRHATTVPKRACAPPEGPGTDRPGRSPAAPMAATAASIRSSAAPAMDTTGFGGGRPTRRGRAVRRGSRRRTRTTRPSCRPRRSRCRPCCAGARSRRRRGGGPWRRRGRRPAPARPPRPTAGSTGRGFREGREHDPWPHTTTPIVEHPGRPLGVP